MIESTNQRAPEVAKHAEAAERQMEVLVGYVLLAGVMLSVLLIAAGLAWRLIATGRLTVEYSLSDMNLAQFAATEVRLVTAGELRPRLLINLGIVVLMLTPFARVLASVLFFAFGERNLKYTVITAFVLTVLSYSLFLR
jgi:uncharacterized membrane protein